MAAEAAGIVRIKPRTLAVLARRRGFSARRTDLSCRFRSVWGRIAVTRILEVLAAYGSQRGIARTIGPVTATSASWKGDGAGVTHDGGSSMQRGKGRIESEAGQSDFVILASCHPLIDLRRIPLPRDRHPPFDLDLQSGIVGAKVKRVEPIEDVPHQVAHLIVANKADIGPGDAVAIGVDHGHVAAVAGPCDRGLACMDGLESVLRTHSINMVLASLAATLAMKRARTLRRTSQTGATAQPTSA